jgi:hypothetical protein
VLLLLCLLPTPQGSEQAEEPKAEEEKPKAKRGKAAAKGKAKVGAYHSWQQGQVESAARWVCTWS